MRAGSIDAVRMKPGVIVGSVTVFALDIRQFG